MTVDPRVDKQERRRVSAEILGIAADLHRQDGYPITFDQALELAGKVWLGAALRQLQDTIQDEAAILRARSVLLDG